METEPLRDTIRYMHTVDVVCLVLSGVALAAALLAVVLVLTMRGRMAGQYAALAERFAALDAALAGVSAAISGTEEHVEQLVFVLSRDRLPAPKLTSRQKRDARAKKTPAPAHVPVVAVAAVSSPA